MRNSKVQLLNNMYEKKTKKIEFMSWEFHKMMESPAIVLQITGYNGPLGGQGEELVDSGVSEHVCRRNR